MGDAQRHTWGAKYSLRKALTRLTGPRKVRKMATIQAFCAWRDPGSNPEEAASGAKTWSRAAPALRLSLRTGIWLTASPGRWRCAGDGSSNQASASTPRGIGASPWGRRTATRRVTLAHVAPTAPLASEA